MNSKEHAKKASAESEVRMKEDIDKLMKDAFFIAEDFKGVVRTMLEIAWKSGGIFSLEKANELASTFLKTK